MCVPYHSHVKRRRMFIKVIGLLLLGAVINVAVAWGLVWADTGQQKPGGPVSWKQAELAHYVYPIRRVGAWDIFSAVDVLPEEEFPRQSKPSSNDLIDPASLPTWCAQMHGKSWAESELPAYFSDFVRGWPLLSMQCRFHSGRNWQRATALSSGIEIASLIAPAGGIYRRALPLRPVWPGFIFNTLFYAAICWVMLTASFTMRRRLRRQRGLCSACAYPVGSSAVCTECGHAL
jgi:hypothetical protein